MSEAGQEAGGFGERAACGPWRYVSSGCQLAPKFHERRDFLTGRFGGIPCGGLGVSPNLSIPPNQGVQGAKSPDGGLGVSPNSPFSIICILYFRERKKANKEAQRELLGLWCDFYRASSDLFR